MPPKTLAHYRILAPLGTGGMGEVYRALDTRLGREVALKTLPADVAADPERLARFRQEAQALAALDHPNIVTVHSVEEAEGTHFLTMGLVEGKTLDQEIPETGLPPARFLEIALPLADAVAAAHDRGIVHRDLKPGNIMLTADGRLKVLDFGLAKLAEPASDPDAPADETQLAMTRDGVVLGTVPYMSPEQVEGKAVDTRSDIFSLGALFYEMATGRRPFHADSSAGLMAAILTATPTPVAERRSGVPARLEQLISRCLEKQPGDRYQSAREIHADLRTLRRDLETAQPPEPAETTKLTLAVFPFADMSPAKDQEYFCEGMAEEIMNALVQIQGIRVASRTSTFRVSQEAHDVAEAGKILKASHILEGSVRVAGKRMRVTAQLVDAAAGYHLWSERYDRTIEDVFAIQDEIAAGVVDAVRSRLAPGDRKVRARSQVKDLDVYRRYLKARHFRYSRNDHGNAARAYREVVEMDPSHAPAWVGLAETICLSATYALRQPRPAYAEARKCLETAARLQGESATALYVRGMIHYGERDWRAAEDAFQRAVAMEPDNVQARSWLGLTLTVLGRHDESLAAHERARETDPLAAYPYGMTAISCQIQGRMDEALRMAEVALEFEPETTLGLWGYSTCLIHEGRLDEGIEVAEKAVRISRRGPFFLGILGWGLARAGRVDEARAILEELRTRPSPDPGLPPPVVVSSSWILAELGETEEAWRVLEEARENLQVLGILVRLPWGVGVGDERYNDFLKSLGLAPN